MTPQQKQLWEKLTNQAKESGMDNLYARKLYEEISKLLSMSENNTLLSITEKEDGLEVRVADAAYGNLVIVGLLERIKMNILAGLPEEMKEEKKSLKLNQKYDA